MTGRSGPLVVEIEYRVAQENARAFHDVMQDVQLTRQRNGADGWSIARDIADPELWTERYHCPTWLDFLRQRNRSTQSERALYQRAVDFHLGPEPVRVRRMLERPFGSVRWKDDTPDRAATEVFRWSRRRPAAAPDRTERMTFAAAPLTNQAVRHAPRHGLPPTTRPQLNAALV